MEAKAMGKDKRVVRIRDEKEFYSLIERHYMEQGFKLVDGASAVRCVDENLDVADALKKERVSMMAGFGKARKTFAY